MGGLGGEPRLSMAARASYQRSCIVVDQDQDQDQDQDPAEYQRPLKQEVMEYPLDSSGP